MIFLDTETFSPEPINHGVYRYAESVEVMLVTYAFDDGPVMLWDRTFSKTMPAHLKAKLDDPAEPICMQNGDLFDRLVLAADKIIDIPYGRLVDTKVIAYQHGLPGGLDALCRVFRLDAADAKLDTGRKLIHLFCKPQKVKVNRQETITRFTRETHPAEWSEFCEYAKRDIVSMRKIYKLIPKWNCTEWEQRFWHLDLAICDRGFAVDTALAEAAVDAIAKAQAALKARTQELTGGEVESATKRDALLRHLLSEYLVDLPDMTAATIERRLADADLPDALRELLAIRLQATTSSTAKYRTLLRGVSKDGRLRGCMQFRGAARTGREAHRLFQPGNLPRPTMKVAEIDTGIAAIKAGAADLLYDNVMKLTSNTIRGCIIADRNRKLVVADWSNVEGRGIAWLAGEARELEAFRAYDAGTGPDLYKLAYADAFNVDVAAVTKPQRQIGKVQCLMLGYGGGVGAWITGAATYRIDIEALADGAWDVVDRGARDEAEDYYDYCVTEDRSTYGLSKKEFVVCDALKRVWRAKHPKTVKLWHALEDAVTLAITTRSGTYTAGEFLTIDRRGNWLRIRLPSGRYLCYPSPKVTNGKISYLGVNPYTKQWGRIGTYGGKLAENVTQAICADILWEGLYAAEQEGYHPILHVHDEPVTETDDSPQYSAERLVEILCRPIPYMPGFPLAAAGFETPRYRKDD